MIGFDLCLGLSWLISSGVLVYYLGIVSGLYREPLLQHFRRYGPERPAYPLVTLLTVAGYWLVIGSVLIRAVPLVLAASPYAPMLFGLLGLLSWVASAALWLDEKRRAVLPVWYFELLRLATREERRFIAFAWLRLPRRMRLRLSGDQRAFRTWAELVRLAFIYGAFDPNSPWQRWQ